MKILHTADWHLGIDLHKVSLLEDQAYFFNQLVKIIEEEQVEVIVIAGDIYDTALASKEAIRLFDIMMTTLCRDMKKEVIVIAGNHDSGERLSSMNQLLSSMGLHVYGKIESKVEPLIIKEHAFYPIPYFHLETIRSVYQSKVANNDEAFLLMLKQAKEKAEQAVCHIAIAHTFCANARISESDRFANVGGSDLVSARVFEGMDHVALGHLHRQQHMGGHTYYSGSPLAYSFSEAAYEKCVLIYDSEQKEVKKRSITALHPLITLKGSFAQLQEQLKQGVDPNAYYKIEMSDGIVSYETLEYFREHVEHLLQLSGKNAVMKESISIQLDEMETMDDLSIVRHFFQDHYGEELDEEEVEWLLEAMNKGKEEEYAS